jgi:D-alanine-D-alanine ligase-like ATP-grasp enzyme
MTAASLLPQAARAAGIGFPELVGRICEAAIR